MQIYGFGINLICVTVFILTGMVMRPILVFDWFCEQSRFIHWWNFFLSCVAIEFVSTQPYQFFLVCISCCLVRMVWELFRSLGQCRLHHGWTWTRLQVLRCCLRQSWLPFMIRSSCWIPAIILDCTWKLCHIQLWCSFWTTQEELLSWYVFCSVDRQSHHASIWNRCSSVRKLILLWTLWRSWLSALIQSQSCFSAPLCELCWSFNVTPLSRLTWGGVLFVSQHERIFTRIPWLVSLSVFACTPVRSNSLTTSTDSLACFAGALTKQLSDLPLSETCVALLSDIVIEHTRVFHSGGGAGDISWSIQRSPLRFRSRYGGPCSTSPAHRWRAWVNGARDWADVFFGMFSTPGCSSRMTAVENNNLFTLPPLFWQTLSHKLLFSCWNGNQYRTIAAKKKKNKRIHAKTCFRY